MRSNIRVMLTVLVTAAPLPAFASGSGQCEVWAIDQSNSPGGRRLAARYTSGTERIWNGRTPGHRR